VFSVISVVNFMSDFTLSKPADDREMSRFLDICSLALHFPRDMADRFAAITGREAFRVVRSSTNGNPIVGGLAIHDMGQFFGGKSLRMGGIGAVGIAPEFRASGAATQMMTLVLRDMRDSGFLISSLYPATVPLYRRAGYEVAGSRYEITIPIRQMRLEKRSGDAHRIDRIAEADRQRIVEFYTAAARHTPGLLDRREFSWKRVYEPRGDKAQGYKVLNAAGTIEGYAFLLQKDSPHVHAQAPLFQLLVNDVQFATPAAGMRLLELIRQHQSVCDTAILYGSPDHPLLALIPERTFTARHQFHWMLRILDVRKALEGRGWNACVRGEVALDVRDDVLAENNAKMTLSVDGGAVKLKNGGAGDAIIDIRGLAALYTGHLSPQDLLSWGRLQIADHVRDPQRVLETLAAMFAGPRPWLGDMF